MIQLENVKDWKYIDVVYKVIQNWWIKLAENTPNLIVGIAVFLGVFFLSKFLSKIALKAFQKLFPNLYKHLNFNRLLRLNLCYWTNS